MCEDDFDPAAGWRCDAADCSGVNDSFSAAIVLYGRHYSTTIQLLYIRVVASCSCTGNELRHSFVSGSYTSGDVTHRVSLYGIGAIGSADLSV
jgi:hypothetical protein